MGEPSTPLADAGAAGERTLLAWERTAIASVALAAIVVRAGIVGAELAIAIPTAALLVLGAGAQWLFAARAYQRGEGGGPHEAQLGAVAALIAISAIGSTALVLGS